MATVRPLSPALSLPRTLRAWGLAITLIIALPFLAACSPSGLVVRSLADELAGQGQSAENDPELARDAAAFYLKLSESVLARDPGHVGLASAVAGGFTQYAYAFVAFEADRLEARDARAAQQLRERAARLYQRGRDHALKALEVAQPGFSQRLVSNNPADWPRLKAEQVPLAYWGAAAWGGQISLSKDNPDVVADLPLAIRLARLAWDVNPAYGAGNLASLMGTFEAARPGGSASQAGAYFDRAIALSQGRSVGAYVAKAEGQALPAGDRDAFTSLLEQGLAIQDAPDSPLSLANQIMRRRARWLLDSTDELF